MVGACLVAVPLVSPFFFLVVVVLGTPRKGLLIGFGTCPFEWRMMAGTEPNGIVAITSTTSLLVGVVPSCLRRVGTDT